MPEATPISVSKQAERILAQWREYEKKKTRPMIIVGCALIIAFIVHLFIVLFAEQGDGNPNWHNIYLIFILSMIWMGYSEWSMTRKFARRLTKQERRIILVYPGLSGMRLQEHIKAYDKKISPREELLRASQPIESGVTLLRAAVSTDETPQDQLLRPTNGNSQ